MDSKNDKIKGLFSKDHASLPPELAWEQMEDGILKKMEELESAKITVAKPSLQEKVGRIIAWFFLSMYLFQSTPSTTEELYLTPSSHQKLLENSATETQSIDLTTQLQQFAPFSPSNQQISKNTPTPPSPNWPHTTDRTDLSTAEQQKALSTLNRKDQEVSLSNPPQGQQLAATLKTAASITVEETSNTSTKKLNELAAPTTPLFPKESQEQRKSYLALSVPLRSPEAIDFSNPSFVFPTLPALQTIEVGTTESQNNRKIKGRIVVLSGLSTWNMGYGSTEPERQPYEASLRSFSGQFNYIHTLKKNYTLLVGLQHQQLESRFDWSKDLEDYTITLTDTVLQIQTNTLTGQQTITRGDVELNVPATRIVAHYNTSRLYQIPIAAGKTWGFKNWQADVLLGGTINIFTNNKGRTLYQGEIVDYNDASTPFLDNRWTINGLLTGRMTYQISERFGITAGIQFQKSLSNWSGEDNIQMRPAIWTGELGVSFSF